jgi:hypothetical protein
VIGPLIEPSALDRVLGYVQQAPDDGARIVTAGKKLLAETGGYFTGATVIDDVTPEMSVARDEIFGPVVAVLSFDNTDEALRLANDTPYELAATVWSKDIDVSLKTARGIRGRDRRRQRIQRRRHRHPIRRLQAVRIRRPRQRPRSVGAVHRTEDNLDYPPLSPPPPKPPAVRRRDPLNEFDSCRQP